jgi:hypothetical protein
MISTKAGGTIWLAPEQPSTGPFSTNSVDPGASDEGPEWGMKSGFRREG